jgi:predicted ribosome quality control (RQC) complex YloA/Tae2 family protein
MSVDRVGLLLMGPPAGESMMTRAQREPPPPPDPDAGRWQGRSVARRFLSPDGFVVLVGRTAADNDILSMRLASPRDFWFHVAAGSGSHVVVRNPDGVERLPRETERFAAGLAAGHSGSRAGGRVAVHVTTCAEIAKPRGLPPGTVILGRHRTIFVDPLRSGQGEGG